LFSSGFKFLLSKQKGKAQLIKFPFVWKLVETKFTLTKLPRPGELLKFQARVDSCKEEVCEATACVFLSILQHPSYTLGARGRELLTG
jgi:hypothetical protein